MSLHSTLDYLRYAADLALTAPNQVGVRSFQVFLVRNTWVGGARPGLGTKQQSVLPLVNGSDGYVNVRQASSKDVALSGGLLKDRDWIIGPLVHPYVTEFGSGGTAISVFQSTKNPDPIESYIWILGQGLPAGGSYFKKTHDESVKSIMYRIFVTDAGTASI